MGRWSVLKCFTSNIIRPSKWSACWRVMSSDWRVESPDASQNCVIQRELSRYSITVHDDHPVAKAVGQRVMELAVLANYLDRRAEMLDREMYRCLRGIDAAVSEAEDYNTDLYLVCKQLRDIDGDEDVAMPDEIVWDDDDETEGSWT